MTWRWRASPNRKRSILTCKQNVLQTSTINKKGVTNRKVLFRSCFFTTGLCLSHHWHMLFTNRCFAWLDQSGNRHQMRLTHIFKLFTTFLLFSQKLKFELISGSQAYEIQKCFVSIYKSTNSDLIKCCWLAQFKIFIIHRNEALAWR